MSADVKQKYPAASANTTAITISAASLASSSTLLAGQESSFIDNTTNLDIDHLISGRIRTGTSPTVNTYIELWAAAPYKIVSGTPSWPDVLDGTDSAETLTSDNVKNGMLILLWRQKVDATSGRDYYMPPTSVAQAFGEMPPYYDLFLTHSTAVALDATGSNHEFHYHRIQKQTV